MKLRTYSSLVAFVAHHASLRTALADRAIAADATGSNPDDAVTLNEMERVLADLSAADRGALHDDPSSPSANALSSGAAERHRARAELKLRRVLAARGLLAG